MIRAVLAVSIALLGGFAVEAMAQTPPSWRSTAEITLPENQSELRVVVRLKTRRVIVYDGKIVMGMYPIAVGKQGWETPVGEYRVLSKEVNPIFKNFKTGKIIQPGVDNPLGVRWIGFWTDGKTQIGFHGTNEPELIGQAVSHGCIRMRNKDVTNLFEQVQVGTLVVVQP